MFLLRRYISFADPIPSAEGSVARERVLGRCKWESSHGPRYDASIRAVATLLQGFMGGFDPPLRAEGKFAQARIAVWWNQRQPAG